ncbi:ring canal kelch homolog [Melanaphis sacchari]|uniref:ring canal kelch homolog n=1 Tax=Melanaphis sacchari TaxID=742174 RepID=UPI000DC13510|nr:ring canal kelch homolog [Melanaphis sacchari]XP_025190840.1 ring canal kelch homolog [Melanaphis sacchari]
MSVNEMNDLQTACENDLKPTVEFKNSELKNFINCTHSVQLLEDLKLLRDNGDLCDIKLKANDGIIIFGHRNVLVAASKYFREILECFDRNKSLINIKKLDSTVLKILLDYIYTGNIEVSDKNVYVLLPAANLLQLDYVSSVCADCLKTYLDASNCLSIKEFAKLHNSTELLSSSEAFINKHFLQVVKSDEFISLTHEKVIELISCNDIAVPCEEKIFECVINWVKHDLDLRENFLPQLMEHVRLPLVAPNILKRIIEEPLLKNSPKYNDIVSEALHFHLIKTVQYFTIPLTIRCNPRQFGSLKKIILLFCYFKVPSLELIAIWFDPVSNLFKAAGKLKTDIVKYNIDKKLGVMREQFVFAMGDNGENLFQSVNMLDVFSPSFCWKPMADMLVYRKNPGVGIIKDSIYAIGGFNIHHGPLGSVEVFDVSIQKWKMVSSMNTERANFGVGVLNDHLYVVGGINGNYYLKSVEYYDPTLDTWTPVGKLLKCYGEVGVGVLNGVMYAIGGSDYLKSVEAYRPSDGVWFSIPDMIEGRIHPGVVVLNGLLYVFGGNSEFSRHSREVYDPYTNTWSIDYWFQDKDYTSVCSAVVTKTPPDLIAN